MDVKIYKLHCASCSDKGDEAWVICPAKNVVILCDLQKDEYKFMAICHECGADIVNCRRVFQQCEY